jgi:class 3 adenylate cyclase
MPRLRPLSPPLRRMSRRSPPNCPVTVVLAELVDGKSAEQGRDPERLRSLSERFLAAVHAIVEAYGGSVDRYPGGSAMALFGLPMAHSDDGERAVRAALQIRNAARQLGDADERAVGAQIGVASGPLLVTYGRLSSGRSFTLTGDAVHLAARLSAAALPDEILVSDAAYQAVSHLAERAEPREVPLPRSRAALTAWQIGGLRGPRAVAARSRFVGRDAELRQFSGAAEACRDTGHGLTFYLRGEAGIGKTRLVEEFQRLASGRGFARHTGLVLDFGGGEQDVPQSASPMTSPVRSTISRRPKRRRRGWD